MSLTERLCVVFDLDGTIVDTAPDLVRTLNHVLATVGCPPAPMDGIRPMIALGARVMLAEGLKTGGRGVDAAELDLLLARFLAHYSDNIAVNSRPFPGVIEALERLRAGGARLGVCTNKVETLSRRLLEALGMDGYFAAVVGRDTLSVCKPHPGHLTGTVERLGGAASRAVMVGDSGIDIETAKAAGIPVIAVTFGYSQRPVSAFEPDRLMSHFDEIDAAIAAIVGARA